MESPEVVLITGADGNIGRVVSRRLEARYRVAGFSLDETPGLVQVDLADVSSVCRGLEAIRQQFGNRIASVVHLGAYYSFSEPHSPKYYEINVRGTERLIEGLREFEVGQFLFASTMLVYRATRPGTPPVTEEAETRPAWAYPESKLRAEERIWAIAEGIPSVMMRIATVYDEAPHSIPIGRQMQRIYERRPISHLFSGNPGHALSMIHIDDLADAIERMIDHREDLPPFSTLNLAEPDPPTYSELQSLFGQALHGRPWWTLRIPKWLAWLGSPAMTLLPALRDPFLKPWMIRISDLNYVIDAGRARRLLGWSASRRVRPAFLRACERLVEDPRAWYRENRFDPPAWIEQGRPQPGHVRVHGEVSRTRST